LIAAALPLMIGLAVPGISSASSPLRYYVALGDSYSSGNGLAPALAGSGACARSLAAYPELVATRLKIAKLDFLACSGATIAQVASQVGRARGEIAQAKLVTLTAGGNDLPFTGLSEACIGLVASVSSTSIRYVPGVSGVEFCNGAVSKAVALLGGQFNSAMGSVSANPVTLNATLVHPSIVEQRLNALYLKVLESEATPKGVRTGTQLVVVQYPTLLSTSGTGNCLLSSAPIDLPVQTVVNGLYPGFTGRAAQELIAVNRLLAGETAAVVANLRRLGYSRISVALPPSSFASLDCQTGSSSDLNGIVLTATSSGLDNNSLHPTPAGHALIAAGVIAQWHATGN